MGELVRWFFSNASQLIESGGIMVGLFFTGFALRADVRSRQADILVRLTENHRALWTYHDEHASLGRIFQRQADVEAKPVTPQEARFIQFFINHVFITFRTRKLGLYQSPEQLETDLRDFFSHPVPRAAWDRLRRYQDRDFADYIQRLIEE
jgi:hypothetical protein